MLTRALLPLTASLLVSACASISVERVSNGAELLPDGLVYYLPTRAFQISATFEIQDCLIDPKPAGGKGPVPVITYSVSPVVTDSLVGDTSEAYYIRYQELAGKTKVVGANIGLYENGTLRSVNALMDDRSSQVITSSVEAIGSVVRGAALGQFFSTSSGVLKQIDVCSETLLTALADRSAIKRLLETETATDKTRGAKAKEVTEARDKLIEAKIEEAEALKTGTAAEKKAATRAREIAEARISGLKQELEQLGPSKTEKLQEKLQKAKAALSEKVTVYWVPTQQDQRQKISYPMERYKKLLTDKGLELAPSNQISAEAVINVFQSVNSAKPKAPNKSGGIVFRQPAAARLAVCDKTCGDGPELNNPLLLQSYLVPQFGALGSLPLKNEIFDENSLNLSLLPDGTVVSLKFDSKAALERGAEAAKTASATYLSTMTNLLKDRNDQLKRQREDRAAARAERLEEIKLAGQERDESLERLRDKEAEVDLLRKLERERIGQLDQIDQAVDLNKKKIELLESQLLLLKKQKELASEQSQ